MVDGAATGNKAGRVGGKDTIAFDSGKMLL